MLSSEDALLFITFISMFHVAFLKEEQFSNLLFEIFLHLVHFPPIIHISRSPSYSITMIGDVIKQNESELISK